MPLDLGLGEFRKILEKHRGAVKSILMNQRIISGIGNIYADEILFRARMHPSTEIARLNDKALTNCFALHTTFWKEAITARLTRTEFQDHGCCRHRGKGGKCPRCGRDLNQRGSAAARRGFVRHCQKKM